MVTWLFPYSQFILTGAASALPFLPAFLQNMNFWLHCSSLWQDQAHAHGTSQLPCLLQAPWLHCPWPETARKQGSKTQSLGHEWTITLLDRSVPTPCYPPGQRLDVIWGESKKLSYSNSHHISNSLCCYTEKNDKNSLSWYLFAKFCMLYLQSGLYSLFCFYYLLLLQFCST